MFQTSESSIEDENNAQVVRRIEDWKCRLIDLSRRNNLLYFKKLKRGSLTVISPDPFTAFNKIALKKNHLEFWLPPEGTKEMHSTDEKIAKQKEISSTTPAKMTNGGETKNPTANQLVFLHIEFWRKHSSSL